MAVLVENTQHQILLVQAYRYIRDTIEWEIPAGTLEKGEPILEAAKREFLEESGYDFENLTTLGFPPSVGVAFCSFI